VEGLTDLSFCEVLADAFTYELVVFVVEVTSVLAIVYSEQLFIVSITFLTAYRLPDYFQKILKGNSLSLLACTQLCENMAQCLFMQRHRGIDKQLGQLFL
jgi:hypothetical protein